MSDEKFCVDCGDTDKLETHPVYSADMACIQCIEIYLEGEMEDAQQELNSFRKKHSLPPFNESQKCDSPSTSD